MVVSRGNGELRQAQSAAKSSCMKSSAASCQLVLYSFTKMTVRVGTLSAVFAKATMPEKGEFGLADLFAC